MAGEKPGAVVHVEMTSKDLGATRRFLETVYGWKFKKEEMAGEIEYWSFDAGSGPGGGLTSPMNGMPPATLNYILVGSIDAAVAKAKSHGAKFLMEKTEIPKVGWFAVYEIPGGVVQAMYEPLARR